MLPSLLIPFQPWPWVVWFWLCKGTPTVGMSIDTCNSETEISIKGTGYMQCTAVVVYQHTFCNLYTLVMLPLRHAASLLPPSFHPAGLDDVECFSFTANHTPPPSLHLFLPLTVVQHCAIFCTSSCLIYSFTLQWTNNVVQDVILPIIPLAVCLSEWLWYVRWSRLN